MTPEVEKKFNDYVHLIRSACMRHCRQDGLYHGVEGCKRLAREIGCALPDFTTDENEIRNLISTTYGSICAIAYQLMPPIDASEWNESMTEGAKNGLKLKEYYRRIANYGKCES